MPERDVNEESLRVQLARMEGKLDMSNLRHSRAEEILRDHADRLTGIERREHQAAGQKQGITTTIKSMWLAGGAVITALVLAVLKKLGLL